jgi:type IV pilus assembly protein PilE
MMLIDPVRPFYTGDFFVKSRKQRGFSLVEVMVVVAIIGILASIALPSYRQYVVRGSRVAAQAELLQLASLQEKIFLNSNSYAFGSTGVTDPYNGTATSGSGLGRTSGQTSDGLYTLSLVTLSSAANCTGSGSVATTSGTQTFTLMAVPVSTGSQAGDGNICVSENGKRYWGTTPW